MLGTSWPIIFINYHADVTDTLGNTISDGTNVPVGSQIKFQFTPYENADISWFGIGYWADSPYGRWITGAEAPTPPLGRVAAWPSSNNNWREKNTCDPYDRVYTEQNYWNPPTPPGYWSIPVYIPLSVNPPTKSVPPASLSSNLACGIPDANGDVICTVTAAGPINANLIFNSTYARFYYRQYDPRPLPNLNCYGNNVPMYPIIDGSSCAGGGSGTDCLPPSSPFTIPIPAQTINFTLNAVIPNNPPTIPIITPDLENGQPDPYKHEFTAVSTDPDGDQIRYGFDWNNDSFVDEWWPGLSLNKVGKLVIKNYVPSGTPQSSSYSWSSGPHTFQVLAQDINGLNSGWGIKQVTIASVPPVPVVDLKINNSNGPLSLIQGDTKNISWTVSNATSCTASSNDGFSGDKSVPSGFESLPANTTSNHTLSCLGPGSPLPVPDSVQVNVSCNESTGAWEQCDCATETKTRTNINAACQYWTEESPCTSQEKNSCRDFNWKEVAP